MNYISWSLKKAFLYVALTSICYNFFGASQAILAMDHQQSQHLNYISILVPGDDLSPMGQDTNFMHPQRRHLSLFDAIYARFLRGEVDSNGCIISTNHYTLPKVARSSGYKDYGQENDIDNFEQQLREAPIGRRIFYGWHHGCSTILNWLGRMNNEQQEQAADCLILRGPVRSGHANNIILDALPLFNYIPGARYLSTKILDPFLFKILHRYYCPWGLQAYTSIGRISRNIPIVLIHDGHNDWQSSVNDARKLYCLLKNLNHPYVYLIENEHGASYGDTAENIHARNDRKRLIYALRSILTQHAIPNFGTLYEDTFAGESYQPTLITVQERINQSPSEKLWILNIIHQFKLTMHSLSHFFASLSIRTKIQNLLYHISLRNLRSNN